MNPVVKYLLLYVVSWPIALILILVYERIEQSDRPYSSADDVYDATNVVVDALLASFWPLLAIGLIIAWLWEHVVKVALVTVVEKIVTWKLKR